MPPELRTEARRLLGDLAALRGLPTSGGPPPLVIQSTEERRRYVVAEFSRTYSPARIDAERRALVAWGLIPADFDLAVFLADLHAEQAAAYYDPGAKRMVLANWLTRGDAARRPDPRARPRPPGPARRPRPVPGRRPGAKRRDRRPPRARRRRGRRPRAGPEPPPGRARLRRAAGRRRPSAGHPDVGQRPRRRAGARLHPDHAHVSVRRGRRIHPRVPAPPPVGGAVGALPGPAAVLRADPPPGALLRPARGSGPASLAGPRRHPARRVAPGARGRAGRGRTGGGPPPIPGRVGPRQPAGAATATRSGTCPRAALPSSRSPRGTPRSWPWRSRGTTRGC